MTASYFAECDTVNAVKALYRRLAMRWHPDRKGGDQETMKAVNAAYEAALKSRDGERSMGSDGKEHYYRWNEKVERAAMDIISKLLSLKMTDVEIDLVGTWVWVGGNTKPNKDRIKALGLRWHSKRIKWYWRPEAYRTRYNARVTYSDLKDIYGCRSFESEAEQGVAVA